MSDHLNIKSTNTNEVYRPDLSQKEVNRGHLKSNKDFQKILSRKDSDEDGEDSSEDFGVVDDKHANASNVNTKNKGSQGRSLFDLSSDSSHGEIAENTPQPKENVNVRGEMNGSVFGLAASKKDVKDSADKVAPGMSENIPKEMSNSKADALGKKGKSEAPSSLYSQLSSKVDKEDSPLAFNKKDEDSKINYNSNFAREQPDLSYINPRDMGAASQINVAGVGQSQQATEVRSVNLQEIINQMVKEIQRVENKDSVDTTINLKNIGGFENVKVVVTSYENAPGSFNIRFENLSPQTQALLQANDNLNALKMGLESKGIVVHMIVTTTFTENRIDKDASVFAQNERERQDEQEREQEDRQG